MKMILTVSSSLSEQELKVIQKLDELDEDDFFVFFGIGLSFSHETATVTRAVASIKIEVVRDPNTIASWSIRSLE